MRVESPSVNAISNIAVIESGSRLWRSAERNFTAIQRLRSASRSESDFDPSLSVQRVIAAITGAGAPSRDSRQIGCASSFRRQEIVLLRSALCRFRNPHVPAAIRAPPSSCSSRRSTRSRSSAGWDGKRSRRRKVRAWQHAVSISCCICRIRVPRSTGVRPMLRTPR